MTKNDAKVSDLPATEIKFYSFKGTGLHPSEELYQLRFSLYFPGSGVPVCSLTIYRFLIISSVCRLAATGVFVICSFCMYILCICFCPYCSLKHKFKPTLYSDIRGKGMEEGFSYSMEKLYKSWMYLPSSQAHHHIPHHILQCCHGPLLGREACGKPPPRKGYCMRWLTGSQEQLSFECVTAFSLPSGLRSPW